MEQWLNASCYGTGLAVAAWGIARPRLLDAAWRGRTWNVALAGLALLLAVPLLSVLRSQSFAPGSPLLIPGPEAPAALFQIPGLHLVPMRVIAVAWALVALWRVALLALAVGRIRAARRGTTPFPGDREARLVAWTAGHGGVRLVISDRIASASMLGFGRPVVAVPGSWLGRLTDEELDSILLHELAHARRRDHLAQLAQQLLLAGCWFHPAAWWINRRIEFEREAVCDEQAARIATTRRYARCLVKIAGAMQTGRWPQAALIASSAARRGDLARRVEHLVGARETARPNRSRLIVVAAAAGMALVAIEAGHLPRVFGPASPESTTTRVVRANVTSGAKVDAAWRLPAPRVSDPAPSGASEVKAAPVDRRPARPRREPGVRFVSTQVGDTRLVATTPPAGSAVDATISPVVRRAPPTTDVLPAVAFSLDLPSRIPAPGADNRQPPGNDRPPASAPYRALGAALSRAGERTGHWFSRAGAAIAEGVTPR